MPYNGFRNGYLAAWQWIKGSRAQHPSVPPYRVSIGETPYQAGFAQGVQAACASAAERLDRETLIDHWLDNATRRGVTPRQ
jgi:hypothetical protein